MLFVGNCQIIIRKLINMIIVLTKLIENTEKFLFIYIDISIHNSTYINYKSFL